MQTPSENGDINRTTLSDFLGKAIFGFLALFAITLPFSIKGAERSWKIALVVWLVKLALDRTRPWKQPLTAPLLAYAVLSATSTILSPDPYLSWDRMKVVCLYLAGIVIAQNVKDLRQVRWLAVLLVLSGFAASLFTAWQYTYGTGVQLLELPASSRLEQVGLHANDTVLEVAGRSVHTPQQLVREIQQLEPQRKVSIKYMPYMGTRATAVVAVPNDFLRSGLATPAMPLVRGRPYRAQGTLGHYVVFAEMLMQIGCLAWALMLGAGRDQTRTKLAFAVTFAGMTAALFATETRAALAGLMLGCLLSLLMMAKGKGRLIAVAALLAVLAGATFWIAHTRQLDWLDRRGTGTQFRVLMWEDGLRLIREHPWFGVGMETVRAHWLEWNIRGFIQHHVQSHFHSTYLQIAVERGIPALLAWLWFCGAYLVLLVRLMKRLRTHDRFSFGVVTGIFAGFVAFSLTGLVHYNLGEPPVAMVLFFSLGIALALDRITSTPQHPRA